MANLKFFFENLKCASEIRQLKIESSPMFKLYFLQGNLKQLIRVNRFACICLELAFYRMVLLQ